MKKLVSSLLVMALVASANAEQFETTDHLLPPKSQFQQSSWKTIYHELMREVFDLDGNKPFIARALVDPSFTNECIPSAIMRLVCHLKSGPSVEL